jgi:hypothetical protein
MLELDALHRTGHRQGPRLRGQSVQPAPVRNAEVNSRRSVFLSGYKEPSVIDTLPV